MRDHSMSIVATFAHEWRQQIYSGRTFIFQACLLLALSVAVFLVGGLFDSDYASFDLVWSFLPAIAIVLVPAFGARAFAQEDGSRELELLLTLPLSDSGIVIGKWLSGTAFLALTLCCAAPIAITIGYLGSPDWGAAAAGAVGAVLMLATFYAVAMFCSAVTGEQTSAYVLAVVALMALTAMGWDAIAQLMPLPASVIDTLRLLSPKLNLDRLAAGRIELVALSSFALEIALALGGCVLALKARRHAIPSSRDLAGEWGRGALVAAAGVFLLAALSRAEIYLDATSGKLFTLDRATLDIARAAPPGTTLNFYWTESDASVPAYIRAHATRVRQMLSTIARRSDGRVKLQIFNTEPDSDAEWRAVAAGIRRVPLSAGGGFFLGVEVAHGEKRQVFPYLDENRGGQFEYDIALALSRMEQSHVPKVGLLSPLIAPSDMTDAVSKFSFIDALKTAADVAAIPFFAESLPSDLDVLVIVGSAPLKREMLYAIDQHLMRGKGLVVLLDPLTRFNTSGKAVSVSATSDLNTIADLLARYGIAFDAGVVGDTELAAQVMSETQAKQAYPFWLRVPRAQVAARFPAVASLNDLLFVEPGSLRLSNGAQALISTTHHSGTLPAAAISSGAIAETAAKLKPDGKTRVLAATNQTALQSAFTTGLSTGHPHFAQSAQSARLFVVADIDWILDPAAVTSGAGATPRPLNDNLALLSNMVDVASGDHRLLSIRSRGSENRRFARVEDLLRTGQARFRAEEADAQAKIDKVDSTIAEILKTTRARSLADLPQEVRTKIAQLYADTIPVRKRQREIRRSMREEVERLGRILTSINLASGPALVLMLWGLARFSRRRSLPRTAQAPRPELEEKTRAAP